MPQHNRAQGRIASIFSAQLLAIIAAGALVIASAGFGATFAYGLNEHQTKALAGFAVLMALGLEIAKPLAVHGIFDAGRAGRGGEAAAMFVLAMVATSYSLMAELQLMARSRADAIAERQHVAGTATDTRAKLDRLRVELDKISPARAVAELTPLMAAKIAATKGADCDTWVSDTRTRGACLDLAQLRAEAGRAAQRVEVATKIEVAETALSRAGTAKVADPSAAALATYLTALGLHVEQSSIGDWLTLVGVFALEVGSMFAVVLVRACRPNTAPNDAAGVSSAVPKEPVRNTAGNAETPAAIGVAPPETPADATHVSSVPPDPARITIAVHPAERLVSLLRERGGEVFGSQRTIGLAIGISGAQLNRVLHDLAEAGRVIVSPGKSGTRVRLAEAA